MGTSAPRWQRRQSLMADICEALEDVLAPRLSAVALCGRAVSVSLDGGRGGAIVGRVAPWLPRVMSARDLTRTATGVADAVHAAATQVWPGTTRIGPRGPIVTAAEGIIRVQFFDDDGEPLPAVDVPA